MFEAAVEERLDKMANSIEERQRHLSGDVYNESKSGSSLTLAVTGVAIAGGFLLGFVSGRRTAPAVRVAVTHRGTVS